ncbi:hypothetical protein HY989_01915 [Candidatus Micrarchaeota archaeon]|nr:hypothetical protein [Candidatus Micrarchaeota archaeon]
MVNEKEEIEETNGSYSLGLKSGGKLFYLPNQTLELHNDLGELLEIYSLKDPNFWNNRLTLQYLRKDIGVHFSKDKNEAGKIAAWVFAKFKEKFTPPTPIVEPKQVIDAELDLRANQLLDDPFKIETIARKLKEKIVGERENSLFAFFAGLSSGTKKPIPITIKGASSGGKSRIVASALALLPPEWIIELGGTSEKGLIYQSLDEKGKNTKIIFLKEMKGFGELAQQTIKLSSRDDGGFEYQTVQKDSSGNLKPVKLTLPATNFISTTTELEMDDEIESRQVSLSIDESEEQTKNVLEFKAKQAASIDAQFSNKKDKEIEVIREAIRKLPEKGVVVIPFAPKLSGIFPPGVVRARRDFDALLNLIAVSAWFYYKQRHTQEKDENIVIFADGRDLQIALYIGKRALLGSLFSFPASLEQVLEICQKLSCPFTFKDLADARGVSEKQAGRNIKALIRLGYIEETDDSKPRAKRFSLLSPSMDGSLRTLQDILNLKEDLAYICQKETELAYNPDWTLSEEREELCRTETMLKRILGGISSMSQSPLSDYSEVNPSDKSEKSEDVLMPNKTEPGVELP